MANWLVRFRCGDLTHHARRKLGLLGILPQTASFNHPNFLSRKSPHLFSSRRFESAQVMKQSDSEDQEDPNQLTQDPKQVLDITHGPITFSSHLRFIPKTPEKQIHCYRVLDENGQTMGDNDFHQISKEVAIKMYSDMVTLQIMDSIFYEAQRQGRISFYLTTLGEEAINIASAAALEMDDIIFPQYREAGVLLWRGFTVQEFANQLFGNKFDNGKGRQMPLHYGSNKLNFVTVSSPIATQIPQAVGAAYSLKMDKKNACAVAYFGDGATSEGDFHAGLNFAAVTEAPIIFICRNNGWAISTPTTQQFRSDGVVVKGQAYGISSIRVDGNDTLAIYSAVHEARQMAINEQRPVLIEALTYRVGHHSTSDDSTKYRSSMEIAQWRMTHDPITLYKNWLAKKGWWTYTNDEELRSNARKEVLQAILVAEKIEKAPLLDLFTDVYDYPPTNLSEQEKMLRMSIKKHPKDYPTDILI